MSEFEKNRIVGFPKSEKDLRMFCDSELRYSSNGIFLPGRLMRSVSGRKGINAFYGIGQLDSRCKELVAVAGFNIEDLSMLITQTPQSLRNDELKEIGNRALQRLRSRDFRGEMIDDLISIAKKLSLKSVKAIPAALYSNVETGVTDYFYVAKRVDQVLTRKGFELVGCDYELKDF